MERIEPIGLIIKAVSTMSGENMVKRWSAPSPIPLPMGESGRTGE